MNQLHAFVSGRVQGVSFRYYTQRTARQLNLSGWVRNLPDGRVEVVAEGPDNALQDLESFLKIGSPGAVVERIEVYWTDASGNFSGFGIRW